MSRKGKPPPIIDGLYVVAFAYADKSVHFEQRRTLNVNGKWLGRVPCLALCTPFGKKVFLIQHCNKNWVSRGTAAGYKTLREAKARIERSYHGIGSKWQRQAVSKRKAHALYKEQLRAVSCSFCSRTPLQFEKLAGNKILICNHCVDSFYEAMHS